MVRIEVKSSQSRVPSAWVEIENITDEQCQEMYAVLDSSLSAELQVSNAAAQALQFAIELCPNANPSDLWHHVIYRHLLDYGFSDQRWKRVSGFALERAFVNIYRPRFEPYGLRLRILPASEASRLLAALNVRVKASKVDIFLEGLRGESWDIFGALHAKSSIAERIQDDVPASLALMRHGFLSVALTMDVKSFPPPHGNGVNHGELGGRSFAVEKSRPKRAYIEEDGQFDALFSFNLRTPPSPPQTASGKRIYTLSLSKPQPDAFVSFVVNHWRAR